MNRKPQVMRTFPAEPGEQVTLANMLSGPYNRWAFRNMRRFLPTANVWPGIGIWRNSTRGVVLVGPPFGLPHVLARGANRRRGLRSGAEGRASKGRLVCTSNCGKATSRPFAMGAYRAVCPRIVNRLALSDSTADRWIVDWQRSSARSGAAASSICHALCARPEGAADTSTVTSRLSRNRVPGNGSLFPDGNRRRSCQDTRRLCYCFIISRLRSQPRHLCSAQELRRPRTSSGRART